MSDVLQKLGVIGAGVMGRALIQGLLAARVLPAARIWAAANTKESCQAVRKELGVTATTQYKDLLPGTDTLMICVKPSGLKSVLKQLKDAGLNKDTLVISIVAGHSIEDMENALGGQNPVIRAMPNTPCLVGYGMSVICPGSRVKSHHLKTAQRIFESVGVCLQLDEKHLNAVTGLSGSGPAYMYLIMEALADGGVRVGLPREEAMRIVTQTVLGAAMMVKQSGRHPAALRDDVTTPAGCTIAGLLHMEDGKIRSTLARAVEEATRTAGELGRDSKA
ncbi:MAG: pyrroline-5-carboxylate reductase [Candidatus Melainabacteria bacterium]